MFQHRKKENLLTFTQETIRSKPLSGANSQKKDKCTFGAF